MIRCAEAGDARAKPRDPWKQIRPVLFQFSIGGRKPYLHRFGNRKQVIDMPAQRLGPIKMMTHPGCHPTGSKRAVQVRVMARSQNEGAPGARSSTAGSGGDGGSAHRSPSQREARPIPYPLAASGKASASNMDRHDSADAKNDYLEAAIPFCRAQTITSTIQSYSRGE